ncbi:MAG: glycosyltransferase family 2 protein [Patescibacteria group bacterium]|nr:glycosyltransferase family 2 protein [Patescibacteria group bacterium]
MDLSVIIVSWNVREKLKENLRALYEAQGNFAMEIFVVDNNSADKSAQMIRGEFPQVELIANSKNLGFARANNQAIKQASGKFILLLNPDMRVKPSTLEKMLKWMRENKQASVAGCHLLDEHNNTVKHVRQFPELSDQAAIILKLPHLFPWILKKYLRLNFNYSYAAKVDSIRGGFFMINRRFFKNAPLLDERYFLWFEEVDFCRSVQQNGGEVWYTPAAECLDYVGQSFKQIRRVQAQKYLRDSMLKYFKKWHPYWQYLFLKLAWIKVWPLIWLVNKLKITHKART